MRPARVRIVAAAALAGCTLAGCGATASLPGGTKISIPASVNVPSVGLPSIPDVDLSKTDPASAKRAVCVVTDYWLRAGAETRKLLKPTVDRVIAHYRASSDPSTRQLADAAQQLVSIDSQSEPAKRATWQRLCG